MLKVILPVLLLLPASSALAAPPAATSAKKGTGIESALKGAPGQNETPVFIRSDNFQLDSKNRLFIYRDNVEVVKGDLTITADVMNGKYDTNNVLQEITCENNVVITRGDRLKATSNHAFYDLKKDRITLTEGPELNDRGNVLTADKVIILVKEDRSEAEGHVRVKVIKSDQQTDVKKNMAGGGAKSSSPSSSDQSESSSLSSAWAEEN